MSVDVMVTILRRGWSEWALSAMRCFPVLELVLVLGNSLVLELKKFRQEQLSRTSGSNTRPSG